MTKTNNLFNLSDSQKTNSADLLRFLQSENINLNLKGNTKKNIIIELLDVLVTQGKLLNRDIALKDLLEREQAMSTAIPNGIALPHAKTNAVQELIAAIGIKKSGVDFDSALDDKTRIVILALAPPEKAKPLYQFLLTITAILNDDTVHSKLLAAKSPAEVVELLHTYHQHIASKE
ncbi:MAG: PTS sugar transporter subunit IIA [Spirochaetaceae bacterium]|jgi:PTS system nitrogen regulatory IIA component|nr:PTS sugar transporter subunit IIA [Spirochaetaceae bacterium]